MPLLATCPSVATEKLTPTGAAGKQLFYDARDTRLARDGYISCASCHNDGGQDGRVWDLTGFGEGLRNTITCAAAPAGQGFLHWSNNFDEVQDFEGQIRKLAGGIGLMTMPTSTPARAARRSATRRRACSADLDALAAYVASLNAFAPARCATRTARSLQPTRRRQDGVPGEELRGLPQRHGLHGQRRATRPANIGTIKPTSGIASAVR